MDESGNSVRKRALFFYTTENFISYHTKKHGDAYSRAVKLPLTRDAHANSKEIAAVFKKIKSGLPALTNPAHFKSYTG